MPAHTAPHLLGEGGGDTPKPAFLSLLASRGSTRQDPRQLSRAQAALFSTASPKPPRAGERLRGGAAGGEGTRRTRHRPAESLSAGYVSPFSSLPPLPFPVYLSRSTHTCVFFSLIFFFSVRFPRRTSCRRRPVRRWERCQPRGQRGAAPTRSSTLLPFLLRFSRRCPIPTQLVGRVFSPPSFPPRPPPSPPRCRPGGRGGPPA